MDFRTGSRSEPGRSRHRGGRRSYGRSRQCRPVLHSAVDYNGGGSGGSNKATTNPEYLAEIEARIDTFLAAHPYLTRKDVPSEIVTASGSGLDPDISPAAAYVQVKRVADARGLSEETVRTIVEEQVQQPWLGLFGTQKVNVLKLNLALDAKQSK